MKRSFSWSLSAVLLVGLLALACGGGEKAPGEKGAQAIEIRSTAFPQGGAIPVKHTCDGEDLSPALAWTGAPTGTKSYALVCGDPDAPGGTWVHWFLFNIPGNAKGLAEGVPEGATMVNGARHGANSWGNMAYGGPCPPPGPAHHYHFKLYALDDVLVLEPGAEKEALLAMMEGHVLATGEVVGTYARAAGAVEEMEEEAEAE